MLRGKNKLGPLKYGPRQASFFGRDTDMVIRLATRVGIVRRSVTRADHLAVSAERTARPAYIARFNHRSKGTHVRASACH